MSISVDALKTETGKEQHFVKKKVAKWISECINAIIHLSIAENGKKRINFAKTVYSHLNTI